MTAGNWPEKLAAEADGGLPAFLDHHIIIELWYSGRASQEQKDDLAQKIECSVITQELKATVLIPDPESKGDYRELPVDRWQDIREGVFSNDYVTYRIFRYNFEDWLEDKEEWPLPEDSLLNEWWETPLEVILQEKPDYGVWKQYQDFAPLTAAICFAIGIPPNNRAHWSQFDGEKYDKLLKQAQAAILADTLKASELDGVRHINKASFYEWVTKQGEQLADDFLARPPVSHEQQLESVPKIDRQIQAIVNAAVALSYDPMKISDGGKAKIKALCLKDTRLFTDASFDHAWKAAKKPPHECLQIENPERYRVRR